jgi:hypothetical protein
VMLFAFVHVPVHVPRIDKILPLVPPDPTALGRTTGISAVARKEISPGSRTLYALNMPAPRVRATMFTRQGRRTDPHGHSHSVELHEAASPYRHPRYDRPSAKEKLIPLVPSAASGREETNPLPYLVFGVTPVKYDNPCAFAVCRLPELTYAAIWIRRPRDSLFGQGPVCSRRDAFQDHVLAVPLAFQH